MTSYERAVYCAAVVDAATKATQTRMPWLDLQFAATVLDPGPDGFAILQAAAWKRDEPPETAGAFSLRVNLKSPKPVETGFFVAGCLVQNYVTRRYGGKDEPPWPADTLPSRNPPR